MSDSNKLGKTIGDFKASGPITGFARLQCVCSATWWFNKPAVATITVPEGSKVVVPKDSNYHSRVPSELLRTNTAKVENIEVFHGFNPKDCVCSSEFGTNIEYKIGESIYSRVDRDLDNPNGSGIAFKLNKKRAEKPG